MAVSLAVKSGRLKASVVRAENGDPKIADPDLADREWEAHTDLSKAPGYVKERHDAPAAHARDRDLEIGSSENVPGAREGMSLSEASATEKVWKAKLAEIKFKQEAGELVLSKDVAHRLTDVFSACRAHLLGLPSRARQALPHLSVADIAALEGLVREALEELADGTEVRT